MIKVEKMGKSFGLEISSEDEKLTFVFKQLSYFARNKVATMSTSYRKGEMILDVGLSCFYTLKYGLKEVKGLFNEAGEAYELSFEEAGEALTDACVDELLACEIGNKLIYATRDLSAHVPKEILDPITAKPIEGIKVIQPKDLKGALEKK